MDNSFTPTHATQPQGNESSESPLAVAATDPDAANNFINIANGSLSSQLSPDEEVIKARGRKIRSKVTRIRYEELPLVLATRKSPRKSSNVDFSHFFRSPTPKKKSPVKLSSELSHIRIRSSIRKRLTLNSTLDSFAPKSSSPSPRQMGSIS